MKIKKYYVSDNTDLSSSALSPIALSSCLVRVPKINYLSSGNNNLELVAKCIISDDGRATLVDFFSSPNQVANTLKVAHSSDLIYMGATSASFETYHAAVLSTVKGVSAVAAATISMLLVDFHRSYDIVMSSSEWAMLDSVKGSVLKEDIVAVLVAEVTAKALAALPKRGRDLAGRVPVHIMAQNVVECFRSFVSELTIVNSLERGLMSTLARVKAYITKEDGNLYGDKNQLFVHSEAFLKLAQNATLVELALGTQGVASDAQLWMIEDQRLVNALDNHTDANGIRLCSLNSISKMINSTVIYDSIGVPSSVLLFPKVPDIRDRRVYRVLSSGQVSLYFKDNRFDFFFSPLNNISKALQSAIASYKVVLSDHADVTEEVSVRYLEDEKGSFDPAIYKYHAMNLATGLFIDKSTNELSYSFELSSPAVAQKIPATLLNTGMTKEFMTVIALASKDISATDTPSKLYDGVLEAEKCRYLSVSEDVYSTLERHPQTINFKAFSSKSTPANIEVDIFKEVFSITKGYYAVTGLNSVRWSYDFFCELLKGIFAEDADKGTFRAVEPIRDILNLESTLNDVVYASLWKFARDHKLDTSSIYNDIRVRLSIKEAATKAFINMLGFEPMPSVDKVIKDHIQYFIEYVR